MDGCSEIMKGLDDHINTCVSSGLQRFSHFFRCSLSDQVEWVFSNTLSVWSTRFFLKANLMYEDRPCLSWIRGSLVSSIKVAWGKSISLQNQTHWPICLLSLPDTSSPNCLLHSLFLHRSRSSITSGSPQRMQSPLPRSTLPLLYATHALFPSSH